LCTSYHSFVGSLGSRACLSLNSSAGPTSALAGASIEIVIVELRLAARDDAVLKRILLRMMEVAPRRGAAGLRGDGKGRLRAGPCPATRLRRWAGQAVGQPATQFSKAALHSGTAALCFAAHACTQAARFFPRLVLQSAIHSPSLAAAPLAQSPIPWAQTATQA